MTYSYSPATGKWRREIHRKAYRSHG